MLNLHKNVKRFAVFVIFSMVMLTSCSATVSAASFRPQINITNSSAVIPDPDPESTGKIIWVSGQVQEPGEGEDVVVQIDYDLALFEKLTINGKELSLNEDYYLEEGSTIITVLGSYIGKLAPDDYTLVAYYADGKEFTTTFVISEHPEDVDPSALSPDTGMLTVSGSGGGGEVGNGLPFVLIGIVVVGAAVWIIKGKFSRSYNPVLKKHIFIPVVISAIVIVGGVYVFMNVFMSASEKKDAQAVGDGSDSLSISATNEEFVKDLDLSNGSAFVSTSQTLTVNDATSHGYKLYISTNSSEYNDLSINGSKTAEARITATSGTFAEPTALEDDSYGFAISNDIFGNNYAPSSTSKWAGVPALGSETMIKDVSGATSAGDATTIYYGFNVTNNLPDGSYFGTDNSTIIYKAVANVLATYEIRYFCNGGTGSIDPQTKTYGETVTLSDGEGCSRDGYELKKWNTVSNGSGTSYGLGASYSENRHLNLYAIWEEEPVGNTYQLIYDTRGGSNGPEPESQTTSETSTTFTISSIKPTLTDNAFKGWCSVVPSNGTCSGTTYQAGGSLTVSTATTALYAIWQYNRPTSISISGSQKINLNQANHTTKLTATVYPSSALNKAVTWSSSNNSIATVNSNGVVTGVEAGEATITAKSVDNPSVKATYKVAVNKKVIIILGPSLIARINGANFANVKEYVDESSHNVYTTSVNNNYGTSRSNPKKLNETLNFIYLSGHGFQFETGVGWNGYDNIGFDPGYSGWNFAEKIIKHYEAKKDYVEFYVYFTLAGNDFRYYTCDDILNNKAKTVELYQDGKLSRVVKVPKISKQVATYHEKIASLKSLSYKVNGYVTSQQPLGPVASGGTKNKWVVANGTSNSCTSVYRSNYKYALFNYKVVNYIKDLGDSAAIKYVDTFSKVLNWNSKNEEWSLKDDWKDYKTTDGVHWTNATAKKFFKFWMNLNKDL